MNKKILVNCSNYEPFKNAEKFKKQYENVYISNTIIKMTDICNTSIYNRTLSNTATKEDIIKLIVSQLMNYLSSLVVIFRV